ncbi:hypothetical protein GGX14DRAFT_394536 [Mycena pura]|uniref:Ndc10 domain-containing protein n=1 Tax=Mycena pura TaxID=153505 RepID=A0AAD6VF03_9AGAR|nr:hypothetical protein GGX14DRAFT_394536 [Mycena pura]
MSQGSAEYSFVPIDPILLRNSESPALPPEIDNHISTASNASPISSNKPFGSREAYAAHLHTFTRKDDLQAQCDKIPLTWVKKDNLARLRGFLIDYWYPSNNPATPPRPKTRRKTKAPGTPTTSGPASDKPEEAPDISDADLLAEFHVAGAAPEELLGYDDDDEDEEREDLADDDVYEKFQKNTRVAAAERFEGNRRKGGRTTQKSVVKAWDTWMAGARTRNEVRDDIVDQHSLLLFIKYSAERPKMTSNGTEIPNTRLGASQIKKLFFGALRIRKTQEAVNPKIKDERACATVLVYDETKTRMDEACRHSEEDAPDIIANTFLAQVTDDQLKKIGYSFLEHLHQTINGHLAWTCQNASGNRGDDFRALKLCEMQPYVFLHPNKETSVSCVLGLQGEEKAGKRGMKTAGVEVLTANSADNFVQVINPTYTTWIAHRNPEICPLGAMAMYHHWLHDHYGLAEKQSIDWAVNKSWRNIRLLFGTDPTVPYNENSLYNLYCMAYKKSNFESNIKQHLPRHMLGYLQERMGVDNSDTAKLGWSRGTYMDTYAPALPKVAILGTHGYKVHENYDPVWRHVRVPEAFLCLMCPEAEQILDKIEGTKNLTGASNYWQMIIELRPYLFQCAAAIFQVRPKSALFRLPALKRADVQKWMKETFPVELKRLEDSALNPLDLSRIQNEALRLSLEEVRVQLAKQSRTLDQVLTTLNRRTAILSPAKQYLDQSRESAILQSVPLYDADPENPFIIHTDFTLPSFPPHSTQIIDPKTRASEDTGVYETDDNGSLRAFISPSPTRKDASRPRTMVDLILPPKEAFNNSNTINPVWSVILGQESVMWTDVFRHVSNPKLLYDVWKPSKTIDNMTVAEIWNCWSVGEVVFGAHPGQKPPIRLVEQHFKAKWRPSNTARKFWQRFREIPEWIEDQVSTNSKSPEACLQELEALRVANSTRSSVDKQIIMIPLGVNALAQLLEKQRKDAAKIKESEGIQNSEAPLLIPDENVPVTAATDDTTPPNIDINSEQTTTPSIPRKRRGPAHGSRAASKKAKQTI